MKISEQTPSEFLRSKEEKGKSFLEGLKDSILGNLKTFLSIPEGSDVFEKFVNIASKIVGPSAVGLSFKIAEEIVSNPLLPDNEKAQFMVALGAVAAIGMSLTAHTIIKQNELENLDNPAK